MTSVLYSCHTVVLSIGSRSGQKLRLNKCNVMSKRKKSFNTNLIKTLGRNMVVLPTNGREAQRSRGRQEPVHFRLCVGNENGRHWMPPALQVKFTIKDNPSDCQGFPTWCKWKMLVREIPLAVAQQTDCCAARVSEQQFCAGLSWPVRIQTERLNVVRGQVLPLGLFSPDINIYLKMSRSRCSIDCI